MIVKLIALFALAWFWLVLIRDLIQLRFPMPVDGPRSYRIAYILAVLLIPLSMIAVGLFLTWGVVRVVLVS